MSHFTGGGLVENLPRIFPAGVEAKIDLGAWNTPEIFKMIEKLGAVTREEMYRVFNMGVGYCLVAGEKDVDDILKDCPGAFIMGEIVTGDGRVNLLGEAR